MYIYIELFNRRQIPVTVREPLLTAILIKFSSVVMVAIWLLINAFFWSFSITCGFITCEMVLLLNSMI